MLKSILVPLDGSTFAEWALPVACSIARASNAKLELITIDRPMRVFRMGLSTVEADVAVKRSSKYLQNTVERLARVAGVQATALVRSGPTGATIARYAQEASSSLIVMTTHARGPLRRIWLGSAALSAVHKSAVPVLLVRPARDGTPELSATPAMRHLLVPLDGSPFAEEVLPIAAGLGELWDADYTLLRIVEPQRVTGLTAEPLGKPPEENVTKEHASASAYLRALAARFGTRELKKETVVAVDPDAANAILRFARHYGTDLIVLTTHGRGGLRRLLLGSVADKVMRRAWVPVLLYRPAS